MESFTPTDYSVSMVGFRPTSNLHLGHYLSIIKPILENQFKTIIFSAELHTLTSSQHHPGRALKDARETTIQCITTISRYVNLDPEHVVFISQYEMKDKHYELHNMIINAGTTPAILFRNPIYVSALKNEFIDYLNDKQTLNEEEINCIVDVFFSHSDILIGGLTPLGTNCIINQLEKCKIDKKTINEIIHHVTKISYGNLGLAHYPLLMAADVILYEPDTLIVGDDQKPNVQIIHEIIDMLTHRWNIGIKRFRPVYSGDRPLCGFDGRKMSSSLNNYLLLDWFTTAKDLVYEYYNRFITYPRRRTEPGIFHECPLSTHWIAFGNKDQIEEIQSACETAKIGCLDCKRKIAEHMLVTLKPRFRAIPNVKSLIEEGSWWAKNRIKNSSIFSDWNYSETFDSLDILTY
jgi:tryptophanyl-tRNA synthetase